MRLFLLFVCALFVICGNSVPPVFASDQQPTLSALLASHKTSLAAVWSVSCGVAVTNETFLEPVRTVRATGSYARLGEEIRIKCSAEDSIRGPKVDEYHVKDGQIRSITRATTSDGTPTLGGSRAVAPRGQLTLCDVWPNGLLALWNPSTHEYVALEELVRGASDVSVANTSKGGQCLIELAFKVPGYQGVTGDWVVVVTLDPSVNYLVREVDYSSKSLTWGHALHHHCKVTSFEVFPQGIFFPAGSFYTSEQGDKKWNVTTAAFSKIRLNEVVQQESLDLQYPHGLPIADNILGQVYQVNVRGEKISESKTLARAASPPIGAAIAKASNVPQLPIRSATEKETSYGVWWFFWLSLVLLILSLLWKSKRLASP